MARDLDELVDAYMQQHNIWRIEGRRGVENLCTLVRALGYKDPQYWGQMSSKACLGDLVMFLEDNPGCMETIHGWIRDQKSPEFVEALKSQIEDEVEDEVEE